MSTTNPSHERQPRARFLVDTSKQLPAVLTLVGVCTACAVVFLLARLTFSGATLETVTKTDTDSLLLDLVYFLAVAIGVTLVGLRITHRVFGPCLVLTRSVEALKNGDYSGRLELREHDYLKELAAAIDDLAYSMRRTEAQRRVFHREMERALDEGKVGAARELNQRQAQSDLRPLLDDLVPEVYDLA